MSVWIKICGLTRLEDARLVGRLEVDAVGMVLWAGSPRAVSINEAAALSAALPPWTVRVGVFVTPSVEDVRDAISGAGLGAIQIHGVDDVTPYRALQRQVLWAAPLREGAPDPVTPTGTTLLLDAYDPQRHGGTGRTINWTRARAIAARERRLVLAGGLTAENVARAITEVRPYGVDASSGVEATPGVKSAVRLTAFVAAVRQTGLTPSL